MNDKVTHFPQYRKLSNNKSYYRITGDRNWDELQVVGSKVLCFHFVAEQYPEILRIQDMLNLHDGFYQACSEAEFLEVEQRLGTN